MTARFHSTRSMRITDSPVTRDNIMSYAPEEDDDTKLVFDDSYWLDTEKKSDDGASDVFFSWFMRIKVFLIKCTGEYQVDCNMQNTKDDCHEYSNDFEINDENKCPGAVRILKLIESDAGLLCMDDLWQRIDCFYHFLGENGPDEWAIEEFKKVCCY